MGSFKEYLEEMKANGATRIKNEEMVRAEIKKKKINFISNKDLERLVFSVIKDVDEAEDMLAYAIDNPHLFGIKTK